MEGTLSAYRIFYVVAQKGNISYAAKELYISQPAISKAIGKLEESLGVLLFFRSSRGVVLTEEGKILYEHTKKAFETLEEGEENLRKIQNLEMGQIRIGASTTLCKYILMPYLKAFIKKYPHIKISITCQSTLHTVKLLEEDKIDIGLIGKYAYGKNLEFHFVKEIQDVLIAEPKYLKKLGDSNIFETANFLLLDEQNISRHYIEEYFKTYEIMPKQILSVGSMDLLIEFAKVGLGIACVIKEFVEADIQRGVFAIVKVSPSIKKRKIGFIYSKKKIKTEAMDKFINFINDTE
ncbi:MAG: LysR family transcriptional regulator [Acetivibrio sp.]